MQKYVFVFQVTEFYIIFISLFLHINVILNKKIPCYLQMDGIDSGNSEHSDFNDREISVSESGKRSGFLTRVYRNTVEILAEILVAL